MVETTQPFRRGLFWYLLTAVALLIMFFAESPEWIATAVTLLPITAILGAACHIAAAIEGLTELAKPKP